MTKTHVRITLILKKSERLFAKRGDEMKQLKHFVLYVLTLTVLICTVGFFLLKEDVTYTERQVDEGEDVYTLAAQYRGTLSEEKWIAIFKRENNLHFGTYVYEGQTVIVPVHETIDIIDITEVKLVKNE